MPAPAKPPLLSGPRDKSLQAYKDWIIELLFHITGRTDDNMSEEEWIGHHAAFWSEIEDEEKGEDPEE